MSQDSYPGKSILRKEAKFGSKHAVKFFKGTWHQVKILERKGPSRGIIQKCEPHERNPCAPMFEERTQDETLHQERCARRVAWILAESIKKLKNADKATLYSLFASKAIPAPISKSPEEREIEVDSVASMHMLSNRDLSPAEFGHSSKVQELHNGSNGQWESANKRGSTSIRSRSWPIRDSASTPKCACSSIAWKTLRRTRILL